MLVLSEQPDIGPVLALWRKLQKSFQSRRVVTKPVAGIGRKLRLHPKLQPIGEPVLQLVDGGFASAERKIVLELQLTHFNDRAADLEIIGFRPKSASADYGGGRQDRTNSDASKTHMQLLTEIREEEETSTLLFAGLQPRRMRGRRATRVNGSRCAAEQTHQT